MSSTKILKNQTASPIDLDFGVTVPASGQVTILPTDYADAAASDDLVTFIGSGDIVVNDGSLDLNISTGMDLIKGTAQVVDTSSEGLVSVVDDSGVKRLAVDLSEVLTGPPGPQGDTGATGATGQPGPAGPVRLEGYAESEVESSTTAGDYQTKVSVNLTGLVAGDYVVEFTSEHLTTDDDMNIRHRIDGVTVNEFEHTRAGGDEASKQFYTPDTTFKRVTIAGTTLDADIQWNDDGGGTARIRRARILVWGVS